MNFLIVTHVEHVQEDEKFFAYAPYVKEINLWLKHVDKVTIVAPQVQSEIRPIDIAYAHDDIAFVKIPSFYVGTLFAALRTLFLLPYIFFKILFAMRKADHIHLRCPGNIGLLGCVAQLFFPSKPKTAKYAGNWDPNSKQPLSYRMQKWILGNTFLTKNMSVLVYGEWEHQTKNIVPFFTASYKDAEKKDIALRNLEDAITCSFIGSLSEGKRPLLAVQIIAALHKKGHNIRLDIYGEGAQREILTNYIESNHLGDFITLHGNVTAETIKNVHQTAHFTILPSKSEGWPKVLAEAMFWGSVPIATPISCVPYMLGNEQRGVLIEPEITQAVTKIEALLQNTEDYRKRAAAAIQWSRTFTLDEFETQIQTFL